MQWLFLLLAIVFEVFGTSLMKASKGFTKVVPSILMFVCYVLSLTFLTIAVKKIDVSVAYAIWSGLGTAMIAVVGIFYFGETVTMLKIISILLIIAGVVGLNLSGRLH